MTSIRFLAVGLINTSAGLSIIYICKWMFSMSDITSNAIGYVIGLLISFSLNSKWTFRYEGNQLKAFARFILIFLFAYSINLFVVLTAIHFSNLNTYLAQAAGVTPYFIVFYLLSRFFVFRENV